MIKLIEANVSVLNAWIELRSTDAGSATAPYLHLTRDSASPAAGDNLGVIYMGGYNDAAQYVGYCAIRGEIIDATEHKNIPESNVW